MKFCWRSFAEEVLLKKLRWRSFAEEVSLKKFYWRSFSEEVSLKMFRWRTFAEEVLLKKFCWRSFAEEVLLEKFCFLLLWCVYFTWTKVYYLLLGENYCGSINLPAQRTCPLLGPINMLVITQFENAVMCKLDISPIAYTSPCKNAFNIK